MLSPLRKSTKILIYIENLRERISISFLKLKILEVYIASLISLLLFFLSLCIVDYFVNTNVIITIIALLLLLPICFNHYHVMLYSKLFFNLCFKSKLKLFYSLLLLTYAYLYACVLE